MPINYPSNVLPDEYFGTQAVRFPVGKEVITISIRLSVFGEVEVEKGAIFEIPEAAMLLMYGKTGAETLRHFKDILPFVPPLIALFQPPDYLLAEWMKPIKKKLLALAKEKILARIGLHYITDAWVQELHQELQPVKSSLKPSDIRDIFRLIGRYGMDEFGTSSLTRLNLKCFVPIILAKVKNLELAKGIDDITFEMRGSSWNKASISARVRDSELQIIKAIQLFGALADKRAVPFLHEVLQYEQDKYAVHVAEALSKCGDKTAVPLLLKILDHPNSDVQVSVILALSYLEGAEIIPTFIQKLSSSKENVQITAAYVLGNLRAPEAFEPLKYIAENIYEASRVRISALKAIGKLDTDASKAVLQNLLKSEKDEEILALCAGILEMGT